MLSTDTVPAAARRGFVGLALYFAMAAVAFPAIAGPAPLRVQDGPPPTSVRAIRASVKEVQAREAVTGSLRAAHDAVLAAREEGAVLEILVREGGVVKKGDPLVRLDDRRLVAQRASLVASLAEAEGSAERAAAESKDADADLAALRAAAESSSSAVSARELRRAETLASTAKANVLVAGKRVEAMQAEVGLIDLRIADATLVAPFDGTVTSKHVEVGEWALAGTELVSLVSTGDLEVWLDVPERLLQRVQGATSTLRFTAGGRSVTSSDVRSVPMVNPNSRTFSLIGSVRGDAAKGISPGMSASAWVPVGELKPTLMIPKDALVYRPAGVAVMVAAGRDEGGANVNGTAMMVPIRILFEGEQEVAVEQVEGGLAPGAVVIVEGNERLFPGTPVSATIQAPSKGESSR